MSETEFTNQRSRIDEAAKWQTEHKIDSRALASGRQGRKASRRAQRDIDGLLIRASSTNHPSRELNKLTMREGASECARWLCLAKSAAADFASWRQV